MRGSIRLLTIRNGLLVVTGVVLLLLISWTSQAAQMPRPLAQEVPTPAPHTPVIPHSAPGLHPPGMEPRAGGDAPTVGPGAASVVADPPKDARPGQLLWPHPEPYRGLAIGGANVTSRWCWPNPGNYWFAATLQETDGELQVRDVAPNTGPVPLGSGPISDGHEIFPRWLDILAGGHAWDSSGCSVFTMTVAQDIPGDAWDGIYAWPVLDKYGNTILMPFVYKGVVGWEHALSGSAASASPTGADARSVTVRRQSDGWIELAVALDVIPLLEDATWFWANPHGMVAWVFDADANGNTGAPGGAEVMVEVWLNPTAKSYEALVRRWEGHRWVYKMTLQPPVVDHMTHTIRVRVGPATLALNTHFAWWVSTAKTMGLPPNIHVTNVMDQVPDTGVVPEGPDFWIIPPTPTPTQTPTPAPVAFYGRVSYESNRGPIKGATLRAQQKQGDTWVTMGQATTDADGQYAIRFVSTWERSDYRLTCEVSGPLGVRSQTYVWPNERPSTWHSLFSFTPVIRVRGQVVVAGGAPEPGLSLRKAFCAWNPACVTWSSTWTQDAFSSVIPLDAEDRFDADAVHEGGPPDSIRLKVFPPEAQRVADVAVPDGCEALAIDLVECANLREGVYEGVKFVLGPALTPTPTPSPTPSGSWVAWADPDGIPVGVTGRMLSFRFEALPYTGTLTVTLGPGLEFPDGTAQKQWTLRVLRGRLQVPVRALQTHLGQQSWVRGSLLGMEDTLPVRLVWQTWLPVTFRHTGWRQHAFGIRVLDVETNQPLRNLVVYLDVCTDGACDRWATMVTQSLDSAPPDGRVLWEPEGMKPPFGFRIQFPTECYYMGKRYIVDHVVVDGPGTLGDGMIEYMNLPSGRYVNNVVYMRPQPSP